jgi:hypothetical protein
MASSRPSAFKKGGGFLNNVVGIIANYEFTTVFPGGDGKPRKPKPGKEVFNSLYFVLTADIDGADKPATTTLWAGSADDFEISDDGKTLTPVDDSVGLRMTTDLGKFLASLVCPDNGDGFPEENLPDDGEPINYEAILGTRVNFIQAQDAEAMAKSAKTWRQSGGKFNEHGQKKGKDGKYYNLTYLIVDAVLALPGTEPKAVAKTATKAGKATKTNGVEAVDITALATEALLAILADNDNEIKKAALPGALVKKLGVKHPNREEVRKLVYSDDFLETEDGWTYDKKSKAQTISLTEA